MNCQEKIQAHQQWLQEQPGLGHLSFHIRDHILTFNLQYNSEGYYVLITLRAAGMQLIDAQDIHFKVFPEILQRNKAAGYWSPFHRHPLTPEHFQKIQEWLG